MTLPPPPENPVNLPGGITLFPGQDKAIDNLLNDLIEKCPAQFVMLAHVSGQIISLQGERGTADLVALGSLVAGDMAASQEIARLTEQYQNYQMILREGAQTNAFIAEAGQHTVLFARVNKNIPLGWARLLIKETSRQLADVIAAQPEELQKLDLGLTDEKLSSLVGDDLDSIWKS
jgi:predicted regulator of Ras-like GTPase activity (Roadblock/LC7/MglB family)